MPLDFTHEVRSPRVVFAIGALARLTDEIDRLDAGRILVLCTPRRGTAVDHAVAALGKRVSGVFDGARMHVPAETVRAALDEAVRLGADLCVSIGGGSAIGLAKAVALDGGPRFVAVPTTYAGSEMTSIWGISTAGTKTTGRDPQVLPRTVLYDPALTVSLPPGVTGSSGMNAVAHAVEALYAADSSPVTSLIAEEAIRALASGLPAAVLEPADLDARSTALYGAWLAGSSLAAAAMGLHHRICHALGGSFGLPHAETHAVVLPHVVAFNSAAAPEAMGRIMHALGAPDAAGALFDLATRVGAPTSLSEIGLREEDLDTAANRVVETAYPNPRPFGRDEVRALLEDAYRGVRPSAGTDKTIQERREP